MAPELVPVVVGLGNTSWMVELGDGRNLGSTPAATCAPSSVPPRPVPRRSSTIGQEKATNPLLAAPDEDTFVTQLLASLGNYPLYFRRLAKVNCRGPALVPLTVAQVLALGTVGAEVVDVRAPAMYGTGHIRGALANPLRPVLATWLGWLAPAPDMPLAFVRDADQDPARSFGRPARSATTSSPVSWPA